jgi:hypothetical protein
VAIRGTAAAWALVSALLLAVFAACSSGEQSEKAPAHVVEGKWGKGIYVGSEFTLARAVTGHRVHVVAQKIECTKCHTPTENSMGPSPKPERCAACHEKEGKLQHAKSEAEKRFGAGVKVDCMTCHAFKFDGKDPEEARHRADALLAPVQGGTGPTAMHGIEAFSPADCKRCHETKQGDTAAVVSHLTQVCVTCHKPHQDAKPRSAPCSGCHDVKTTHASQGKSLVETCTTCHQNQHAPASAARSTCVGCHSKEKPVIPATALFAGGHTECTGCHKPHQFDSKAATACTSCHAGVKVIGGSKIPAHNACTSCHSPHNVRGSPANACANCHKDLHPQHPKLGPAGSCVGCHDPHPSQVIAGDVGAKDCSSCHKTAHSDQDFHRGVACEGCHKPHQFKLEHGGAGMCQSCHSERVHQTSTNPGHQACPQCHQGLPHRPELAQIACETCHGREHASAVKPGHERCTQCHEPHSGAQATPCRNCHKEEHKTAPPAHQACTNCHEPHGGVVQKACANCHAAEAKTPHGQVATGCVTCHRPHGPSGAQGPGGVAAPPACTTCHKPATLPGLHAQTKHQTCTNCHTGHPNTPSPTRQACLQCHQNKTQHFPDAPVCSSCHLFTKTQ